MKTTRHTHARTHTHTHTQAEQDVQGLLDALEGVGLRLRPDVPLDLALLVKYFFRDAVPKDQARAESQV